MNGSVMETPVRNSDDAEHALHFARMSDSAMATLDLWRHWVRRLPLLSSSDPSRVSLMGLVAWYERVCVDDSYANPAPSDGVDELSRVAHDATSQSRLDGVTFASRAVEVARELVSCRRDFISRAGACGIENGDDATASLVARLDVAIGRALDESLGKSVHRS